MYSATRPEMGAAAVVVTGAAVVVAAVVVVAALVVVTAAVVVAEDTTKFCPGVFAVTFANVMLSGVKASTPFTAAMLPLELYGTAMVYWPSAFVTTGATCPPKPVGVTVAPATGVLMSLSII